MKVPSIMEGMRDCQVFSCEDIMSSRASGPREHGLVGWRPHPCDDSDVSRLKVRCHR